jgi:hypothetical protein
LDSGTLGEEILEPKLFGQKGNRTRIFFRNWNRSASLQGIHEDFEDSMRDSALDLVTCGIEHVSLMLKQIGEAEFRDSGPPSVEIEITENMHCTLNGRRSQEALMDCRSMPWNNVHGRFLHKTIHFLHNMKEVAGVDPT